VTPLPLAGQRVLVTRARGREADLVRRLEAVGADVVHAPVVEILPPAEEAPLRQLGASLAAFDWLVFTSVHGVDAFLRHVPAGYGFAEPGAAAEARPRVCAVGPATAERLARGGWPPELVPFVHRAEGVVAALRAAGVGAASRVLFVRGATASDVVPAGVRALGAVVQQVIAYRTAALPLDPAIAGLLEQGAVDVVIFTSGSTVRHFVAACHARGIVVSRLPVVACLGPVTAAAARACGLDVAVLAQDTTPAALAEAVVALFKGDGRLNSPLDEHRVPAVRWSDDPQG
jgi:uroporphyrinogen-III synthase